jgi:hypothetical protein
VTETFSEMLEFAESNIDDLTDAQTHELKCLKANDKALKQKIRSYQQQLVEDKIESTLIIN